MYDELYSRRYTPTSKGGYRMELLTTVAPFGVLPRVPLVILQMVPLVANATIGLPMVPLAYQWYQFVPFGEPMIPLALPLVQMVLPMVPLVKP